MEIIPEAFSPLYPRAFIIVINSLDSPHNNLPNNALYPWRTSEGKDKQSLSIGISIGSAKFKHERNAIVQHIKPLPGAIRHSSNYIRSGFLSKDQGGSGKLTEVCIRPSCQTASRSRLGTDCSKKCSCEQLILGDMCTSGGQESAQLSRLLDVLPSLCENTV